MALHQSWMDPPPAERTLGGILAGMPQRNAMFTFCIDNTLTYMYPEPIVLLRDHNAPERGWRQWVAGHRA